VQTHDLDDVEIDGFAFAIENLGTVLPPVGHQPNFVVCNAAESTEASEKRPKLSPFGFLILHLVATTR
jgi:hypothetical protein